MLTTCFQTPVSTVKKWSYYTRTSLRSISRLVFSLALGISATILAPIFVEVFLDSDVKILEC